LTTIATISWQDDDIWLKLELGEAQFVHKIVVYQIFYTNWDGKSGCTADETAYRDCKENQSGTEIAVLLEEQTAKTCGTLTLNTGLEQVNQTYSRGPELFVTCVFYC